MRRLEGIGCNPAVVLGTREDFMAGIGQARCLGQLPFPEKNGPILWPRYTMRKALSIAANGRAEMMQPENICDGEMVASGMTGISYFPNSRLHR
jgi:hypothetical protein